MAARKRRIINLVLGARQVSKCNNCKTIGHIANRDCSYCYKCKKQGHYSAFCITNTTQTDAPNKFKFAAAGLNLGTLSFVAKTLVPSTTGTTTASTSTTSPSTTSTTTASTSTTPSTTPSTTALPFAASVGSFYTHPRIQPTKTKCSRCSRYSHDVSKCYAKTDFRGNKLD